MESLEFYAKLSFISESLGGARVLNCSEVDKLMEVRKKMGIKGRNPGCDTCSNTSCELNPRRESSDYPKNCGCSKGGYKSEVEGLVEEVTKKVLEALKK